VWHEVVLMANLTITINERLFRRARMRALEDGTSINALLLAYLERHAGAGAAADALGGFARLARASTASSGPGGRKQGVGLRWSRRSAVRPGAGGPGA
jgi:hypothetical protein